MMESYGLLDSYRHKIAGTDCVIEKAIEVGEGFACRTCYHIEDRKRLRHLMEEEIRAGKYTQDFFDAIDGTYKDVVRDIRSFRQADLAHASSDELIAYFDRYYHIYITTLHPMVLAIYASDLQDLFEAELRKAVGDVSQEKMLDHTALLLTPTRLTQVQKEEEVLFSLQALFLQAYPSAGKEDLERFIARGETTQTLEKLETEYGFFHMEYIGEPKFAADYAEMLRSRIEDLQGDSMAWKDLLSPAKRLSETIQKQKDFFDAHQGSEFFKRLVFAMQEFLIVLDYSKVDLVEGIYHARPLLSEIGKRTGLDWVSVRFLLPDEIRDHIRNSKKADLRALKERMEYFVNVLEDYKINSYFGDEAHGVANELLEREEAPENIKEFKGLTAYPGKVRGIACIVTGAQDRDKFRQGQIMVTRDTTTELTSIIKKASAIIADQGSMLSHTAIVSREFKIPCLVQTKFGTKVVKDGDELEVDASNGIVRILR